MHFQSVYIFYTSQWLYMTLRKRTDYSWTYLYINLLNIYKTSIINISIYEYIHIKGQSSPFGWICNSKLLQLE